jgi:predicted metallo-beta-lactamase superfamily hydrolase
MFLLGRSQRKKAADFGERHAELRRQIQDATGRSFGFGLSRVSKINEAGGNQGMREASEAFQCEV